MNRLSKPSVLYSLKELHDSLELLIIITGYGELPLTLRIALQGDLRGEDLI